MRHPTEEVAFIVHLIWLVFCLLIEVPVVVAAFEVLMVHLLRCALAELLEELGNPCSWITTLLHCAARDACQVGPELREDLHHKLLHF